MIILTTEYDHYALKPFEMEVKKHPEQEEVKFNEPEGSHYIFLKVGHRIQMLVIQEIIYIEGMKDYLRIHTTIEKVMTC